MSPTPFSTALSPKQSICPNHPVFVIPTIPPTFLLKKALYGLKQTPRQWYHTFSSTIQSFGFTFSTADPSLMLNHRNHIQTYIQIYVDDILLTGNDQHHIQYLLSTFPTHFQIKPLGELSTFLGIQTVKTPNSLFLHQSTYLTKILQRAGMQTCKPVPNPSPTKATPNPDSLTPYPQPHLYRHLVGSLQYLTTTRPDIALPINKLCQHLHHPLNHHFAHLKRLLCYLQGTPTLGITIHADSLSLQTYVDSDWAGDPSDRKSTTGHCSLLGRSPISWCVKKQSTVARSSTEA